MLKVRRGVIIGGGAEVNWDPGAGNMLTALYRDNSTNVWMARSKDHGISSPAAIHAWCITANVNPNDVYVARSANAHDTGMTGATAILPKEYQLVSGGARAYLEDQPDAGALLVTSFPEYDAQRGLQGWTAEATDHIITSPVAVEAYAIGLSKDVIARHKLSVVGGAATGAGPDPHPFAEVSLDTEIEVAGGRGVVTGGGGIHVQRVSNFLFQSFPIPDPDWPKGWRVSSKDHGGVNAPTQILAEAFAIIALR